MEGEIRKAAVLLMSLPEEQAAGLMSKLSPKQIESVSIEIAKLGRIPGDEQDSVINEFTDMNPNKVAGSTGNLDLAKSLVEKALGKDATKTLDNVRQTIEALPFGFLKKVDPQNLLTFITEEHPQTISLILSHMSPKYGAEVIKGLPPNKQLQVVRRIAKMGQTSPEVIREVERGLEIRMSSVMSQSYENAGGVQSVAGILNVSDRAVERVLLDNLMQEDPELVEEIRRLMFVFEDIAKLSDKDMQTLMKNVENSQWAMALKGTSEELRQKVQGNMSQRAAAMLKEEIEFLGAVRSSEVEAMQQQIVDVVRRLEDAGEVTLQHNEGNEEFIQ
jgi:flagellar motor switch protein FliG